MVPAPWVPYAPSMPDIETLSEVPAAQRLLLDIIDTVREPLIVLDAEFRVTQANRAFFRTFRVEPGDTIGEVLFTLGDGQWDIAPLRELLRDKLAVEPQLNDFDVDHEFPGIGRKIMLLNARLVSQGPNLPRIILLAIEDTEILDAAQLKNYLIERTTPGQRVSIKVRRVEADLTFHVVLGGG